MELIAQALILIAQPLTLLLQHLDILIALAELLLQLRHLAQMARLSELLVRLVVGRLLTPQGLDLGFQAQGVEDEGVGAVKDEGEEEGEAAEVHVALGVEFASLDLHAFGAGDGAADGQVKGVMVPGWRWYLRCGAALVLRHGELDLHAVDAVDGVDEEDENEDEGDLQG